ncbi:CheW protein [Stanieria cyanosphaera PCC 7437]|uniref:CheW protein n=1 Tax=Stanieria cyanosphaera (strain ATCC 29371 / PCC 7437) TaxID=111780 RepID=K9XZG5_STAC7|nr:chemotaxis protein CheW [Stanieria cyanosphaera]AFZ37052.1 CheW protein [Stanieria cyanosphaera PCC 7437]
MVSNSELLIGNEQELSLEIKPLDNPEGELHLRFYLASGEELALPATGIAEVMHPSPDHITPIPNASPLLLGTINLRGKIIWVADLGQFLADSGILNTDRPTLPVIAIEHQEQIIGLAIDRIGGMDWLDTEKLEVATNLSDSMAPFIHKQWKLDNDSTRILRLLDQVDVLRSARWAA